MKPASFPTSYDQIIERIDQIDPIAYGRSRNFITGAVTKLSPYISRGVISTRQVAQTILQKGFKPYQIESFLKELAWRDYFQQVWMALGTSIDRDIKQQQSPVQHHQLPVAILEASTGIQAIDQAIQALYDTGYMHNHVRMYTAGITCNIGRSHWLQPAKWMYYHLLDADWASNALSWQWVAGAFSSKKYIANQENINRYCNTQQQNSFVDLSYEELATIDVPAAMTNTIRWQADTSLPAKQDLQIDTDIPTYVYDFYNLDPEWGADTKANRVLLFEPSFYQQYPVSQKTITFLLDLSKNIPGIQVFTGEFQELSQKTMGSVMHYKEHPTKKHYQGIQHERDWMFPMVTGYFPSFFSFWKLAEKRGLKEL